MRRGFSAVTPAGRERELVEKYLLIEDAQERLQALSTRKPFVQVVPESGRAETALVKGCSSPVWIVGSRESGVVRLQMFSSSPLVYSLAGIVCDLCDGMHAAEVLGYEPQWIDGMRLQNALSSTRQGGLQSVLASICRIAATAE